MGIHTKFTVKAPRLVEYMNSIGIQISAKEGTFTQWSNFTLPSGASACIFDEDAWGETLYGTEEMSLPRCLSGVDNSKSRSVWLMQHLSDFDTFSKDSYSDDECDDDFDIDEEDEIYDEYDDEYDEYYDDDDFSAEDNTAAFCQEMKAIIENHFQDKDVWHEIAALDDLIEEAEFLYFNYYDGYDFQYDYITVKNGEMTYSAGYGDDEICDGWYWRDLDELMDLIKKNLPAETYKREKGSWVQA